MTPTAYKSLLANAAKGVTAQSVPDSDVKKPSKYRNVNVEFDGRKFDSKKELHHYKELLILQRSGHITNLACQVRFELIPKSKGVRACSYIADFTYTDYYGEFIVCDVKPFIKSKGKYSLTSTFIMKQKLMLERHGITIKLY